MVVRRAVFLRALAHPYACRRVLALALFGLGACATTQRGMTHGHASQDGMPCSQAAGVTSGALLRLGYSPEVVAAPKPGTPGTVVGRKNSGWSTATPEPGVEYVATVTITCSNQGAEFDAITDEPIPASLTFKMDFAAAIEKVAARRVSRPRLPDRPETGLLIGIEPLRAAEVSSEFGGDLTAAGITPVRVKIDNRTDRTYAFSGAQVQLVTQEGERVERLDAQEVARLSASLQATMHRKGIADATISPNGVVSGFLFFPRSAYRRATLVLIDQATDEEEGFSVEF